jgi:hypothetical protein
VAGGGGGLSKEEVESSLGFDVVSVVHAAKKVANTAERVKIMFLSPASEIGTRAHAYHDEAGTCVIELPKREVIMQRRMLDELGAKAKLKAAICEEVAHCSEHETLHNDAVVRKTLACMDQVLTEEEKKHPYIQEKIKRLERSPERVAVSPLRVE